MQGLAVQYVPDGKMPRQVGVRQVFIGGPVLLGISLVGYEAQSCGQGPDSNRKNLWEDIQRRLPGMGIA